MKKLYYLLLLSLFTSFILMSNDQENKNKVLAQQLSTINTQFQKWKKELEGYKKWALENDGVLSAEEQTEIDRRQKDMDAILARVAQIVKAKGLLAFMGLPTKEETKATAEIEEKEILPTETTLERPDPLKSVAALDNEEAMGMLGSLNPEVTVMDDHIPKFAFIQKAQSVLNNFDNFSIKDDYQLDAATAISLLDAVQLATPLGKDIKQTIISKIPAGKISVSAINLAIVDAARYWNDKDRLGEHYEKNEAAYSAKESTGTIRELEKFHLDNDINGLKTFFNTLKENHKEVENKKEKAEEEKKKELKEEKAKFDELIMSWYKEEVKDIINELEPLNVVSKTTLSSVLALSFLTEDSSSLGLLDGIKKRIYDALGDKEMMVMDFKQTFVNQIDSFFMADSAAVIFEKYFKPLYPNELHNFKLPTGFGKWLRNGSKVSNARGFLDIYNDWKGKIENVAAQFCLDIERMAKEDDYYKVDSLKVKDKVKKLFDKVIVGTNIKPGAVLWDNLESKLSAAFYTAPTFKAFWEDAAALCNENSYFAVFTEVEKSGLSVAQMDAVIKTGLKTALPSSTDLLLALHDCDYKPSAVVKADGFAPLEDNEKVPMSRQNDSISFSNLIKTELRTLTLSNEAGNILYTQKILNSPSFIFLKKHNLPKGVYTASLDIGEEEWKPTNLQMLLQSSTDPILSPLRKVFFIKNTG